MKKNQGFSFVELMVVLSIAAILITGAAVSIRSLQYADTQYCAKQIDAYLYELRMETMSQGELHHYLVIEWDNMKKEYILNVVTSSGIELDQSKWKTAALTIHSKKIAGEEITIAKSSDGIHYTDIRNTNPVMLISYVPENGAFESSDKQLRIASDSKTSTIYMVSKTGNHYIK